LRGRAKIILAVATAAVAIGVIVLITKEDEPVETPKTEYFGANATRLRHYAETGQLETLNALAASMADQQLGWARVVVDQAADQRVFGPPDWAILDPIVSALARQGIRMDAVFVGTAPWAADPADAAACDSRAHPGNIAAWAGFVGAAVARYGRDGTFWDGHPDVPRTPVEVWEIGNEPNLAIFWCPASDPEGYAEVFRAAREAALSEDPQARIVVGGLAPGFLPAPAGDTTVPDFLKRMVEAEPALAEEVSAVGIHPYAPSPAGVRAATATFRDAVRAAGLGETPMIANEVGWYTRGRLGPQRVSESDRAERLPAAAVGLYASDCGVEGFGVHAWVTEEINGADPEHWYGVVDPVTAVPHPSARAYGDRIEAVISGNGRPSVAVPSLCD